jgi:hypothetical protein
LGVCLAFSVDASCRYKSGLMPAVPLAFINLALSAGDTLREGSAALKLPVFTLDLGTKYTTSVLSLGAPYPSNS